MTPGIQRVRGCYLAEYGKECGGLVPMKILYSADSNPRLQPREVLINTSLLSHFA